MMHVPCQKIFEVSSETEQWNWAAFSPFPEKVTHYRCQEVQHVCGRKRTQGSGDAVRMMMGLHVVVLWPNMRGGFQQVLMIQESRDTTNLLTLAWETETTQKLLWLLKQNFFWPKSDLWNSFLYDQGLYFFFTRFLLIKLIMTYIFWLVLKQKPEFSVCWECYL